MPAAPVVVPLDGAPDVDVVVVGAGPAGASAALRLAERGLDVALVERAGTPGAKNLSGGVLYLDALVRAVGDAWREAPLERVVTRNVTTLLTADAAGSLDYADSSLAGPPARGSAGAPNAATVLRA
ncbi:MAG: FAD-dependent oxidoreductase, partial [Salana multivorans]|nr:FAD-dependent oxidoreductase [Salana multivorans]